MKYLRQYWLCILTWILYFIFISINPILNNEVALSQINDNSWSYLNKSFYKSFYDVSWFIPVLVSILTVLKILKMRCKNEKK